RDSQSTNLIIAWKDVRLKTLMELSRLSMTLRSMKGSQFRSFLAFLKACLHEILVLKMCPSWSQRTFYDYIKLDPRCPLGLRLTAVRSSFARPCWTRSTSIFIPERIWLSKNCQRLTNWPRISLQH